MNGSSLELIPDDDSRYARLTIPTQQSGAKISQSGWKIGGDTIARTTSKGKVEGEPYKDYVTRCRIETDVIELGVLLQSEPKWGEGIFSRAKREPRRTIRISNSEITDVRKDSGNRSNNSALVFETAEDVYELVIFVKRNPTGIVDQLLHGTYDILEGEELDQVVDRISSIKSQAKNIDSNQSKESIAEELERIRNLYEEGSLTEQEFTEAKQSILDDS